MKPIKVTPVQLRAFYKFTDHEWHSAAEYGRRAVGIELNPEYIKLAKERTDAAMAQEVMQI